MALDVNTAEDLISTAPTTITTKLYIFYTWKKGENYGNKDNAKWIFKFDKYIFKGYKFKK